MACVSLSELIQTEFNHVRTLRIMEGVFRRGMLEELMLEMGVVHAIFPCLDQLLAFHSRFLSLLLARRNHSLATGSTRNFTIQQLGDILVEQVSMQRSNCAYFTPPTRKSVARKLPCLRQIRR